MDAPLAVSVTELPAHTDEADEVMDISGGGVVLIVREILAVHPTLLVPVTR